MDNITHSLTGWALAETGLKRKTRKGLAACIMAANMPDIDVFFGWAPWAPLAMHRGFTHGLVGGVFLMPPLLAGLLWLLDRWQLSRGRHVASGLPMHFGWLLLLCYLGAITHPLLDLQNTYAVQLLSPVSAHWFHSDGLFIVSPWLLAILAAGVSLARKGRWGGAPAIIALGTAAGFIVANIGISAMAWQAPSRAVPYARADRVFAAPHPVLFWRRDVVWRDRGRISHGSYDPFKHPLALSEYAPSIADNIDLPIVRLAARATPEVKKFLAWSQMPFARVERQRCSAKVTFGDARFSGGMTARGFAVAATVPIAAFGCPR